MAGFKPATLKIRIESLEEGQNFLNGLIVAQSNNSCELFPELIEGVNAVLAGARKAELEEQMEARRAEGMP